MKINKKLVPMKAHYFLIYSGLAPIAAFVPVIAKDLGFSALIVGTIYTIVPLLAFPIKIFLGGIADKFQCQKPMFLLLLLLQTLSYLGTYWIPSLPIASSEIDCENGVFKICSGKLGGFYFGNVACKMDCGERNFNFKINGSVSLKVEDCSYFPAEMDDAICNVTSSSCQKICDDDTLNEILFTSSVRDDDVIKYYQFWLLFVLIATARISGAAVTSNADAITLNLLGEKSTNFGLQRLWGAAGWGTMSLASGFVIDMLSKGSYTKNYTSAYYFLLVFAILDLIVSSTVDFKVVSAPSKSIIKDVFKVMNNRHILVYMIWCLINGVFNAMVSSFLFWFLEEVAQNNGYQDMTYIKTLEGMSLTFQCYFGEVPFFFISSWFINKLGHINAMTLVLGTYAVRFILYSFLTNPWWTLPLEMLHGITYGIFYTTMTTYASNFSTDGTRTTIQNFVAALYDSLGFAMGNFIGGYLIQFLGGIWMFWYLGLIAAFLCVLHAIVQLLIKERKHSGSDTPEKKENESPPRF